MLLDRIRPKPKRQFNPVFWPDELSRVLGAERFERARSDPDSVDLLVWNVFRSLETHSDQDFLAYRLKALVSDGLRPPLRLALWTGRSREPLLRPHRVPSGSPEGTLVPSPLIEVSVRIESPDVLALVDVASCGQDAERLLVLIDAGLLHARRLSKQLAVSVISMAGTQVAEDVSTQIQQLRAPDALADALPHHTPLPPVLLGEASWQQVVQIFEEEVAYLRLGGQPVRAFLDHTHALGLR
jgi:hypothetical protein